MTRRSPEQVHDEDGHVEFVASCKRCQAEAEQDQNAADVADTVDGEQGTEAAAADQDVHVVEDVELLSTDQDGNPAFREVPAGHDGPLPDANPAGYPDDAIDLPAEPTSSRRALTADGRPKCYVDDCPLPEFADDTGLCGGHWSNRPDLRKVARNG